MKTCKKCKLLKNKNEFGLDSRQKDRLSSVCKNCIKIISKQYRSKNKINEKIRHEKYRIENKNEVRDSRYKNRYNIKFEQKNQMLIDQNGLCASCKKELNINDKNVCIDHNHKTGKIRKILCKECNFVLGLMDENYDKIVGLLNYVKYCNELTNNFKNGII